MEQNKKLDIDNMKTIVQRETLSVSQEKEMVISEQKYLGKKYEIIEKLGQGGMGVVYKAYDHSLKRYVAIKTIHKGNISKKSESRFLEEAYTVAKLQHNNIIPIYDMGKEENVYFFVMKLIEGQSLEHFFNQKIAIQDIISIFIKIAYALEEAHQKKIIHRDIKPSNIMIDKNKEPTILDFGLAKNLESDIVISAQNEILGTLAYMSPEQAMSEKKLDEKSDIFSLGVVLYQAITDVLPFQGEKWEILHKIAHSDVVTPSKIKPDIPKGLEKICLKALKKDKNLRHKSMKAFGEELENFLKRQEIKNKKTSLQRSDKLRNKDETGKKQIVFFFSILLILSVSFCLIKLYQPKPKPHYAKALLDLLETGDFKQNPKASACVVYKKPFSDIWEPLLSGEELSKNDQYRFLIFPQEKPVYCYIFQIDTTGKIDWLFPKNETSKLSGGGNPVPPGLWLQFPDEGRYYALDDSLGEDYFYIIITAERWIHLEEMLVKAIKEKSLMKEKPSQLKGVGALKKEGAAPVPQNWKINLEKKDITIVEEGNHGVLLIKNWVHHVKPDFSKKPDKK